MRAGTYFSGYVHAGAAAHFGEPFQTGSTHPLKAARLGARFPYSGTVNPDAPGGELKGCGHHLLLGFGTAGAGDDERGVGRDALECYRFYIFHFLIQFLTIRASRLYVVEPGGDSVRRHIGICVCSGGRWSRR